MRMHRAIGIVVFLAVVFCVVIVMQAQTPPGISPAQPLPATGDFWKLSGNVGTSPPADFLGTRDLQPLVFKTGGFAAMRIDTDGNVGIGITIPVSKLHVVDTPDTTEAAVQINFINSPVFQSSAFGVKVNSAPLNVKGAQIGVRADTSKIAGLDPQRGSAIGMLSATSGFFASGNFQGVVGMSRPNTLDNFDNTRTSRGLGGRFIAQPDTTLTLDDTGTYWVGGAYGEVAGTIDNTPNLGAVAGIIGVDNAAGTADSYAGYFDGRLRVTDLPQNDNLSDVVVADSQGVLHTRDASTLGGDDDWQVVLGNMFSIPPDNVGIGTSNPAAKLHIDEAVSTTNQEVARVTFSNDAPNLGVRGIRVVSTPLSVKGTQIGVEAQTSKTGGPDAQRGSAQGSLSHTSGFFLRGTFLGVQGTSRPNVLDNFNDTARSHGLGGFFKVQPDNTLTLDNTGTYWIGGAYGEVAGTIDNTPSLGAVAGIIGVDNAAGTADSYAGYFDGRLRVTDLPQNDNLSDVVVADSQGVLHTRDASTLGGADDDWQVVGSNMYAIPSLGLQPDGRMGIGTTDPKGKVHIQVGATGADPFAFPFLFHANLILEDVGENIFQFLGQNNQKASIYFGDPEDARAGQIVYHHELDSLLFFTNGEPGSPDVVIDSVGNVGIGTSTPGFRLEVNGDAAKPGGGSWSNSSDRRLKKNVQDLDGALDQLLRLRGVTFEYKDPATINEMPGERIGMIAQEVEEVLPDWVNINSRGHKTVTFRGFEALTVEALRDLRTEKDRELANHHQRVAAVERENQELRERNADIESRLAQLEVLVTQLAAQQGVEQ